MTGERSVRNIYVFFGRVFQGRWVGWIKNIMREGRWLGFTKEYRSAVVFGFELLFLDNGK